MNCIKKLLLQLKKDETGIVISSELVLIATIGILPLVVGLSEVSSAINEELSAMAQTFYSTNRVDSPWDESQNDSSETLQCEIVCGR